MNLLKQVFSDLLPTAPEAAEAQPQQPPRVLTDADIAAVAGGPVVQNGDV